MAQALLFRQLFDQTSGTYTYLLADPATREAVYIDTVFEQYQRDLSLLQELDLTLLACLETHCHADHVTAGWLLKLATGCQLLASRQAGIDALDRGLAAGDRIAFGGRHLTVIETPGHTDGCISYVLDDQAMVFTGDALLIRGCGRTDFQQGSAHKLFHSIKDRLFALPDDCVVYPAHDYVGRTASTIGEEKRLNPRVGGRANETDFVVFMENMRLPHPKKLDIAVPANQKAGRPADDQLPKQPDWAPVFTTYSGVLEVLPQWVAAHRDSVLILDVRTPAEIDEEKIFIAGAQRIPLGELRERIAEVPADKPVLTICRSGRRSVLAYNILRDAGRERVAHINGGLLRWRDEGLPLQA
ncbi:MAG: hypothetical protein RLZZ385_1600 [Pseudomonadota bacterium]|jgi:glyoxylase-like metal-dependent hydrolase (beta-lactamase superfamily II)/rhodanese-related sulfurtransferase